MVAAIVVALTSASNRKCSSSVDTCWPVIRRGEQFCRRYKQDKLVTESQGCHAEAA